MNYNFILLLFLLCIKSHYYYAINICEYKKMKSHNSPEIYWINMDKSIERRDAMQKHLDEMGVVHHRFRALTNDEILIPDDIDQTWNHADRALFQTKNIPPSKIHGTKSEISSYSKYSAYISGLFGRRRSNRLKEIGCTVSHILAMKEAVNSKTSKSKYALIIEDDVHFPFDIDFDEMVASVSLTYPGKTFGIYQLFNSNEPTLKDRYNKYQHGGERNRIKNLWLEKFPWQPAQFWSTCAYLIDRKALKPVLETIIIEHEGWKDFKLIAGLRKSCSPVGSICCPNNTYDFSHNPPCILAPKGFQADSFLYSLANSIILSIPVIANGHGGNQSTFHQDHVETIHASSFRTMRSFINEMFVGNTTMPNFIKSPCIEPKLYQSIALKLTIAPPCNYLFLQKSALPLNKHNIVEIFWINYEKSQSHIAKTKDHLKSIGILSFTQVISGITVEEMYIPVDVLFNWETAKCMSKSDRIKGVKPMEDKYLISGLCGRGNNINTLEDLSITLSHMLAIKKAVYSTSSSSKYALIIEDDISFVFDIDLNLLGDSAPIDFGILQLSGNFYLILILIFLILIKKYIFQVSMVVMFREHGLDILEVMVKSYGNPMLLM